ncbi:MAG: permease [Chloroflexota bacterium]
MPSIFFDRLPNLITVFLGIFLEAGPFLIFGVLVSSFLEISVSTEKLSRFFPRNAIAGLFSGVALGAAAPLCECGTVPIARASISKGLPLPAALGFLLAAPVINPITVAATFTAFRDNLHFLALRMSLGIAIALLVGGLFLLWPGGASPLRGSSERAEHGDHQHEHGRGLGAVLEHTAHELSSLMVYLVGAALVASMLQVFLPRAQLISLGQGPLLSVAIMMVVAIVLSTCSSVDAFVALAFSTTFAPGAILAFLLISPVLNLKSGALVIGVFRPSVTIPLLSASTATVILAAIAVNYHLV